MSIAVYIVSGRISPRPFWRKKLKNLESKGHESPVTISIMQEFADSIRKRFPNAWEATEGMLFDYLYGYPEGYLSKQETGDYFIAQFSAAAGNCEVSALVAQHWFDLWFRENISLLTKNQFKKLGFQPDPIDDRKLEETSYFFPLRHGYAELQFLDSVPPQFRIDEAIRWALAYHNEYKEYEVAVHRILQQLDRKKRCYCQLCFPSFDVSSLDELPPWK